MCFFNVCENEFNFLHLILGEFFEFFVKVDGNSFGQDGLQFLLSQFIEDSTLLGVVDFEAIINTFSGFAVVESGFAEHVVEHVADADGKHHEKDCQIHFKNIYNICLLSHLFIFATFFLFIKVFL